MTGGGRYELVDLGTRFWVCRKSWSQFEFGYPKYGYAAGDALRHRNRKSSRIENENRMRILE